MGNVSIYDSNSSGSSSSTTCNFTICRNQKSNLLSVILHDLARRVINSERLLRARWMHILINSSSLTRTFPLSSPDPCTEAADASRGVTKAEQEPVH